MAVRFVDPGHPEEKLGPRYRVWFRNNGAAPVTQPFNVMLFAGNDERLAANLPQAGVRVTAIEAGDIQSVDIRLPVEVYTMGRDAQGNPAPFAMLHVLVDANREVPETTKANNGARLAPAEILPVDPAAFEVDPVAARPGGEVLLAGEGFGPQPGRVLVVVGGQEMDAEILGWYDLGVRLALPRLAARRAHRGRRDRDPRRRRGRQPAEGHDQRRECYACGLGARRVRDGSDGKNGTHTSHCIRIRSHCLGAGACRLHYRSSHFRSTCHVAARPPRAMAVVSGISFGQTFTQFWALPQTWMPPSATRASSRSAAVIAPIGFELNSSTWAMAWAPMNARRFASRSRAWNCSGRLLRLAAQLDLQELRAGLQAAAATHALAVQIGQLLLVLRLPRAGPHVQIAVDRQPGPNLLQHGENPRAVDHQVAEHGNLVIGRSSISPGRSRQQLIHQRGAGLADPAVDQHRAGAADLFQAVALPGHRRHLLAFGGHGPLGDLLQHADAVHVRLVLDAEPLPVALLPRAVLPQDANGNVTGRLIAYG